MRVSKGGKSVHLEVGFWLHKDGSIHLTANDVKGFHVAINEDPKRKNGHPTLYKRLSKCLAEPKNTYTLIKNIEMFNSVCLSYVYRERSVLWRHFV